MERSWRHQQQLRTAKLQLLHRLHREIQWICSQAHPTVDNRKKFFELNDDFTWWKEALLVTKGLI